MTERMYLEMLAEASRGLTDVAAGKVVDARDALAAIKLRRVRQAWQAEALCRRDALRNGETTAVPWPEAKARLAAIHPRKGNA